jgi:hypothetical protein
VSRGKLAADSPENWAGTRTPVLTTLCGWCMDALIMEQESYHRGCNHETGYYDKLWVCACDCNAEWVPQAVTVERGGKILESATEPLPRPEVSINVQVKLDQAAREAKALKAKQRHNR